MDEEVRSTFARTVQEGDDRTSRSWPALLATGLVGGIDLGVGVLALLVVRDQTGSPLLGALAFGVGFLALILAGSELFTENFLVPVAALVANKTTVLMVLRLWLGTLAMNFVGGWVVMALVMTGLPGLGTTAIDVADHYIDAGITVEAFALAVLAGAAITLMTWMERGTESVPAKLVAAWSIAFVLVAAPLNHVIVSALELFAALQAGAGFGYLDMAGATALAGAGNVVGGLGLVTMLRLVQVGPDAVAEQRRRPSSHAEPTEAEPSEEEREEREQEEREREEREQEERRRTERASP